MSLYIESEGNVTFEKGHFGYKLFTEYPELLKKYLDHNWGNHQIAPVDVDYPEIDFIIYALGKANYVRLGFKLYYNDFYFDCKIDDIRIKKKYMKDVYVAEITEKTKIKRDKYCDVIINCV